MKIIAGSENPVKIKAIKSGFEAFYSDVNVEGIKVGSGVSVQPSFSSF